MRLLRTLGPTVRALFAHRARSLLAASGVAIGIAAVFLTSAIGQGAQAQIMGNLGTMGSRLLVVRPAQVRKTNARKETQGLVTTLTLADWQAIASVPRVQAAAPAVDGPRRVRSRRGVVATTVLGTTSDFFRVRHFEVRRGRLFDEEEDAGTARLAVLGGRIADSLFAGDDPVGQEVHLGGVGFEVVGVLASKGISADGSDADNQVFIPIRTALRRVFNTRSLSTVFVGVKDPADLGPAETGIRALLRERHRSSSRPPPLNPIPGVLEPSDPAAGRPDDFTVQDQLRFLAAQRKIGRSLSLFTSGLAAISLLIGGTGILALMLLSVRERTGEIGLRMAVGATRRDILLQFLAEASALSLAGGAAGIALGALGTWAVALATGWPLRVSVEAALISLATAFALGLGFGGVPAGRAALLPPVQALARP